MNNWSEYLCQCQRVQWFISVPDTWYFLAHSLRSERETAASTGCVPCKLPCLHPVDENIGPCDEVCWHSPESTAKPDGPQVSKLDDDLHKAVYARCRDTSSG